ncbi:MAG: hypothetical protein KatS3mg024_1390 [Armatimonadota bacterium]|nr:MAG: hypothetical protein KatS3mg024_1390 [Armatimonadota bacterium]
MSYLPLASLYLAATILIVDAVYRGSLALRARLVAAAAEREAANISYLLGLLPPLAGLLSATAFSLAIPALAMTGFLVAGEGLPDVLLGAGVALCCAALAVAPLLAQGWVVLRPAPAAEMKARSVVLALVGLDLLLSATFEEVVFRGQLLQVLRNGIGDAAAVAVSAGVFGAVHIWKRRDAPPIWAINTALFGILAGLLVLMTGGIAASITLHFVWNMVQTPLLGLPANGSSYEHGLLVAELRGPHLFTGGSWSLDAGLASTFALLVAAAGLALLG